MNTAYTNIDELRRLPLLSSYETLANVFGIDVSMFLEEASWFAAWYFVLFCMYLPFVFAFGVYDWGVRSLGFNSNAYTLLVFMAKGKFHCFYWLVLQLSALLFIQLLRRMRRVEDTKAHLKPSIEDYSLIISNLGQTADSAQLIVHITNITQTEVAQFIRVNSPSLLKYRMKYIKRQRQFYDQLQFNSDSIVNVRSRLFEVLQRTPELLRAFETLGLYHDAKWYDQTLRTMKLKISAKIAKKVEEMEGMIVTFETVAERENALRLLRNQFFEGRMLRVQCAFHPDDTIYYNISITKGDRWKREFLTYSMIVVITVAEFLGIALLRDYQRGLLDSTQNYFLRLLLEFSCFLIMFAFDWCLRPFIYWGVAFEGHKSFSTQEQSWMSKYFIYSLFNKLTIVYSHDFYSQLSDLSSPFEKKFDRFIAIFSGDSLWRFGYGQVGTDIFYIMVVYITVSNIFVVALQFFIKLGMKVTAVSKYDRLLVRIGPNIRWSSLYVYHLVMYTLITAYGFEQPYILLMGIAYFIVHSLCLRPLMFRFSRLPPRIESVCKHAERIECYITIGSVLAVAQFNYGHKSYFWIAFLIPFLVVYFFLNSRWFTELLKYFIPNETFELTRFKHEDELEYKIERNPPFATQQMHFMQYQIPTVLTEEETRHMFHLMAGIKQNIETGEYNGHSRTASERSVEWSSQNSRMDDYTIAQAFEGSQPGMGESDLETEELAVRDDGPLPENRILNMNDFDPFE